MDWIKQIRDPVLGWIKLSKGEVDVLDSQFMQRLRYINQLGLAHYVYPTARHSRFEHSLGCMHIATMIINALFRNNEKELKDSMRSLGLDRLDDLLSHVRAAALLHDIGHLPFSHALEGVVTEELSSLSHCSGAQGRLRLLPAKEHEITAYLIMAGDRDLEGILKNYVDPSLVRLILHVDIIEKSTLLGNDLDILNRDVQLLEKIRSSEGYSLLKLLHGVISGDLDADRLDYMLRDLYFTGASVGANISIVDIERIMDNIKVKMKDGEYILSFDEKARASLEGFIIARYNLYKWVYLHHKVVLMTTLAREVFRTMIRNSQRLGYEVRDYLCDILSFMNGSLKAEELMKITDPYFMSILVRNKAHLIEKLSEGFGELLDSIITRKTPYKALWKRDAEFLSSISSDDQLSMINTKFPELLNDPDHRERLLLMFYRNLSRELDEECPGLLDEEMGGAPSILMGHRYFEADIKLRIDSGNSDVEITEISALAGSVTSAWLRSPHIFVFINQRKLGKCRDEDVIAKLRGAVVRAIERTMREYSMGFRREIESL